MSAPAWLSRPGVRPVLFFTLVLLLFFQLVSEFIESIYAAGLLNTEIPTELASVVLFFTPFMLLFFRRAMPFRLVLGLALAAGLLRALSLVLPPSGRLLAEGVGIGALLLMLPGLFAQLGPREQDSAPIALGAGLALALAFSILLRTLGAGSDLGLLNPLAGWVFYIALLWVTVELLRGPHPEPLPPPARPAGFGAVLVLCIGLLSALLVLYFTASSPTVLARWAGADYRLVLLGLAAALGLFFASLTARVLDSITRPIMLALNVLLALFGVYAVRLNTVEFLLDPSIYPLDAPVVPITQGMPLFLFILLVPVVIFDFILLSAELIHRRPTPRVLAGGFGIAALLFLAIVMVQAFTTVWDYVPVLGPPMRDQLWLVFLAALVGLVLPMLAVRQIVPDIPMPALRVIFLPLILALLLGSVVWAVVRQPQPAAPADDGALRVMTFNLQQGYSDDGVRAYRMQADVIRAAAPDILGLQESDTARFSGGNADLVRYIAEELEMYSYYGPKTVTGTFGIALLSRYPIIDPQTFYLYSDGEQAAAILARIEAEGQTYHVLVTHLGNGGPLIQQENVLVRLDGLENVIAMGDFNFRPDTEQFALTDEMLDSAWVLAGSPTVPDLDPARVIDHIFVSPGTPVRSAEYILTPVSDHPALVVELGE